MFIQTQKIRRTFFHDKKQIDIFLIIHVKNASVMHIKNSIHLVHGEKKQGCHLFYFYLFPHFSSSYQINY